MRKAIEFSAVAVGVSALLVLVAALQFGASGRAGSFAQTVRLFAPSGPVARTNETTEPAITDSKQAQSMVKSAIAYMREHGRRRLIAQVDARRGPFNHGSLYLSIIDLNGVVVAEGGNPRMIGRNISDIQDAEGKRFIRERLTVARTAGSGWQSYRYVNPLTGRFQPKTEYFELADGLIVASGVFK